MDSSRSGEDAGSTRDHPFPSTWRILRDPPSTAAWNMAADEALARSARPDEGVLRIYRWARPTLSFGRNQSAILRYDPAAAAAFGAEIVRRPTGGREVLHDRELTYSVTLPARALGGPRAAYSLINRALVAALRSLGVDARQAERDGPAPRPDAGACFGTPVEGEVEVSGRKIAGSAQLRMGKSLLQHGSLLLAPPSVALEALERPAPGSASTAVRPGQEEGSITLSKCLTGAIGFPRVAAAVEAALAAELGGVWQRGELTGDERVVAERLLPHYQSHDWTWRR